MTKQQRGKNEQDENLLISKYTNLKLKPRNYAGLTAGFLMTGQQQ